MADYNWPSRNRPGTFTARYKLYQPKTGETGWGEDVDINFALIDEHLGNKISEQRDVVLGTQLPGDILIYAPDGETPRWINTPLTLGIHTDIQIDTNTLSHGHMLRYYKPTPSSPGEWRNAAYLEGWDLVTTPTDGSIWIYQKEDPTSTDPNAKRVWRPTTNPYLRTDGTNSMSASLNLNSHTLSNVADPVNDTDGVNLRTLRNSSSDYWKDSVKGFFNPNDFAEHYPLSPAEGDRWISNASKDDGTNIIVRKNAIYTYTDGAWVEYIPQLGSTTYVDADKCPYTYNDEINTIDPSTHPSGGTFWAPIKGDGSGSGSPSGDYVRKAVSDTITAVHTFNVGDNPVIQVDESAKQYARYVKNTVWGLNADRLRGVSPSLFTWGHAHEDTEGFLPWGVQDTPGDYLETVKSKETGEDILGVKGIDADKLDGYHYYDILAMIEAKDDVFVRKTEYNYQQIMPLLMVQANTAFWKPGRNTTGYTGSGQEGFVSQYLYDDTNDSYVHASQLIKLGTMLDHGTNLTAESLKDDDHIQYLPITSARGERHIGPEFQGTLLCTDLYMSGELAGDKVLEGSNYRSIYGVVTPTTGDANLYEKVSHAVATVAYVDQRVMGINRWEPVVALVDEPVASPSHGERFIIHKMKRIVDTQHPTNLLWYDAPRVWSKTGEIPATYVNGDGETVENPFVGHDNRLATYDATLNSGTGGYIITDAEPAAQSAVYVDLIKEQYNYNDTDNEWYLSQKLGSHQDLSDRSSPDAHTQYINNQIPYRAVMKTTLTLTNYEYSGTDGEGKPVYSPFEWNIQNVASPRSTPYQNAITDVISQADASTFYNYQKDSASRNRGIGYKFNRDVATKAWVEPRLVNNFASSHSSAPNQHKYRAVYADELPSNPPEGTRALVCHKAGDNYQNYQARNIAASMPNCIVEWHYTGEVRPNDPWSGGWWYNYTPDKGQIAYIHNDDSKPDGEYLIFDDHYRTVVREWFRENEKQWCPNGKWVQTSGGYALLCREPLGGQWENLGVAIRHETLRNARPWKYALRHSSGTPRFTIREFYIPSSTNGGYPAAPTEGIHVIPTRNYPAIGTPVVKGGYIYTYTENTWIESSPAVGDIVYCSGTSSSYVYSTSQNLLNSTDPAYETYWNPTENTNLYRRYYVDYSPDAPEGYTKARINGGSVDSEYNPDGISMDAHHQYMRTDGTRHEVRHHKYPVKHNPYIGKSNFPQSADPFDDSLSLPSYKDFENYAGYKGTGDVYANNDYFSIPHDSLRWLDDVLLTENDTASSDKYGRKPLAVSHGQTLVYWNDPSNPTDPKNKKWINMAPPQGVQHHYQFNQDEREDRSTTNLTEIEKISHHQYVRVNLDSIVPIYPSEEFDTVNPQRGLSLQQFNNAKVVDFSTLWINEWNKVYNNGSGGANLAALRYGGDRGDYKYLTYTTNGVTKGERSDGHKATGIHRILPPTTENENAWIFGSSYYGYIPHDRIEGLVNVWSSPERIPIAHMTLPLDIGGKFYFNGEYKTGAELIAMGHTTGDNLIDPTGITHYDGRIDHYTLQFRASTGMWAPCNVDSSVTLPQHDVLPSRNLHSNHPFYIERGWHGANISYDHELRRPGVFTWVDHFGNTRTAVDYVKDLDPGFSHSSPEAYSLQVHNLGPKFDVISGNNLGGEGGNIPRDELSGLRDVVIYSNLIGGEGAAAYPKFRYSPVSWPAPDPEDPTPPDHSFEFGNALAEGHVLMFHNGRWSHKLLPTTPTHNQLNGRDALNAHPQYIGYGSHHTATANTTGSISASLGELHAYYSDYVYARTPYGQLIETPQGYSGSDALNGYYIVHGNIPHDQMFRLRDVSLGDEDGSSIGTLPTSPTDQKVCKSCGTYNAGASLTEDWTCSICSTVNHPGDTLGSNVTKDGYFLAMKWVPFIDGEGHTYYKHRIVLTNSVTLPPGFTIGHGNLAGLEPTITGWTSGHASKYYEGDHHPQYLGNVAGWDTPCYAVHTFMGSAADETRVPFKISADANNMVANLCAQYLGDGTAVSGRRTAADFALKGHTHSFAASGSDTNITDVKIDSASLVKGQVLSYTADPNVVGSPLLWRNVTIDSLKPRINDLLDVDVEDRTYFRNAKSRRFTTDPASNNYAAGSLLVFGDPHLDGERERLESQNSTTMWQPLLPPDPTAIDVNKNQVLTFSFYQDQSGAMRPWIRWADPATTSGGGTSTALSTMSDVNPSISSAQQFSLFYKGAGGYWNALSRAYTDGEVSEHMNTPEKRRVLLTKLNVNGETGEPYLSMTWGQPLLSDAYDVAISDISTLQDGTLLYLKKNGSNYEWSPLETPDIAGGNYSGRVLQSAYDGTNVSLSWGPLGHASLGGLQGGQAGEYYHLTEDQVDALTHENCTIHNHNTLYYTKDNLRTAGQSEVSWDNISDIVRSAGDASNRIRNSKLLALDAGNPVGWSITSTDPATGTFTRTATVAEGGNDYNIFDISLTHANTGNVDASTVSATLTQTVVNFTGIAAADRKLYLNLKSQTGATTLTTGKGVTTSLTAVFNDGSDHSVNIDVRSYGVVNTESIDYALKTIQIPETITADIFTVKIIAAISIGGTATVTDTSSGIAHYWIREVRTHETLITENVHQVRYDSTAAYQKADPIPLKGELICEYDNGKPALKVGDGVSKYSQLTAISGSSIPPEFTRDGAIAVWYSGSWHYAQPPTLPTAEGTTNEEFVLTMARTTVVSGGVPTVTVTPEWKSMIDGGSI